MRIIFKNITYNEGIITYSVSMLDKVFVDKKVINIDMSKEAFDARGGASFEPICVIEAYKNKCNVAAQIAKIYSRTDWEHWINYDAKYINEYFPQYEYGTKYYPCVIRQMKRRLIKLTT